MPVTQIIEFPSATPQCSSNKIVYWKGGVVAKEFNCPLQPDEGVLAIEWLYTGSRQGTRAAVLTTKRWEECCPVVLLLRLRLLLLVPRTR